MTSTAAGTSPPQARPPEESVRPARTLLQRWNAIPLYLQIVVAMLLAIPTGLLLQERAHFLEIPSRLILQLLGAIAPVLILVAVVHVLMTTDIRGRSALRLGWLLLLNTTMAIVVGLCVANVVQPGKWSQLENTAQAIDREPPDPVHLVLDNVPRSMLGPLGDKPNIIGVVIIAVAVGIALRRVKGPAIRTVQDLVEVAYQVLLVILHWVIYIVPIGVFAIVARVIGKEGFGPFKAMGVFIIAVLLALSLQTAWYLIRIRYCSWVRPLDAIRGMRDALVMAFSTASSTATMPVTYASLKQKVGLREESASMGSLVGANFNNDGTALYEAMSALFIAQMIGVDLSLGEQLIVVLTSIIASVGAAGIPEAGLVTMTLVFTAVKLPTEYIALLLTVDWFLDRCRTTINVLGDVNVSCLLDGKVRQAAALEPDVASVPG